MEKYFITEDNLQGFAKKLSEGLEVFAPYYPKGDLKVDTDDAHFFKVTPEEEKKVDLKGIRTVEPIKIFFFKLRSKVADYYKKDWAEVKDETEPKRVVFGVRDCDLQALKVQDVNFKEGDFVDPFFTNLRETTLLFAADCTHAGSSCFCTLLDQKPYAEEDYDLNFSAVDGGYVVAVGSEKGADVVEKHKQFFGDGASKFKTKVENQRKAVTKTLIGQNKEFDFEGSVVDAAEKNITSERWHKEIETCIECAACTNVCPSCRCYYLRDQVTKDGGVERLSSWDSCQIAGYSRMAGGGNARPLMVNRFTNRFMCKFNWGVKIFGQVACKGCGRCIDACMGKIDIRAVMKGVAMDVKLVT